MNHVFAGCLLAAAIAASPLHAQTEIFDANAVVNTAPAAPTPRGGADIVVLDFEGLDDAESVDEFYNGGVGGDGSGPGADYGIRFSTNSLALIDSDAGGGGNFGGEPSPSTVLFFTQGVAATMNVPAGFSNGFSFYYSAINTPGFIVVYDGLDGSGNELARLDLPLTPNTGAPDPTGAYSPFVPIGISFTGVARSIDFGGSVARVGFDNITLGASTPGGGGTPAEIAPVPIGDARAIGLLAALLAMGAGITFWRRSRTS